MSNDEVHETTCSNCGESCSEQDIGEGGLCGRCDEEAAEDLRAQAEEIEEASEPGHIYADAEMHRW